jgi:hypothetical protein
MLRFDTSLKITGDNTDKKIPHITVLAKKLLVVPVRALAMWHFHLKAEWTRTGPMIPVRSQSV